MARSLSKHGPACTARLCAEPQPASADPFTAGQPHAAVWRWGRVEGVLLLGIFLVVVHIFSCLFFLSKLQRVG